MKIMKSVVVFATVLVVLLCVSYGAQAIPKLQIYIPGATYDAVTETWVINSSSYELWVVGANENIYDVKFAAAVPTDEDGSIGVTWLDPSSADYGIGSVSSLTFTEGGAMDYTAYRDSYKNGDPDPATYGFGKSELGDYPLMGDGSPLPGHGVFPTDFYEYFIGDFGLGETVQNYIPGSMDDTASGEIKKFRINVSGYTWVDLVAYDHYIKTNGDAKYVFSPFSHDGGSAVPEPATALLFGIGMLSLGVLGRKRLGKET